VTRENSSSTNVSPCQTLLVYLPASHLLVSPFFMPVYCTGFLHISSQTNLPHPHTQLEELNVCGKSNLLRLYVKKLTTVQFVAVKMVYRNVLESTSIFQCPICIYTYHSCMHKCNPTINFYSLSLILKQLSSSIPVYVTYKRKVCQSYVHSACQQPLPSHPHLCVATFKVSS